MDLCLLCEDVKGKVKTRKLKNDFNAATAVIRWLCKLHVELTNVHIIMEATGVYHESLVCGFHKAGAMISLANPYRSRVFARGMGILTKNDRVDAYMLACCGALKAPETGSPPPDNILCLRALLRRRDALVADSVREKNRLEKCRATDTPVVITESIENMLRSLRAELKHLDALIQSHLDQHPELKKNVDLLTSIKSVGFLLGLNMLVILRCHHFETAEQAAAFLGVVPVEKHSGTSVRERGRLSKIVPPEIRAKRYLTSLCGMRFNPKMKAIYERLCQRGKAKMCAIGALMRKLVHWCYGVLKSQKPFDAEYCFSDEYSAYKVT